MENARRFLPKLYAAQPPSQDVCSDIVMNSDRVARVSPGRTEIERSKMGKEYQQSTREQDTRDGSVILFGVLGPRVEEQWKESCIYKRVGHG